MKYRKIILIFPGQGSQYIGMGKEFYDTYGFVRDIFDQASEVLGYDVADVCFKGHKIGKFMHIAADINKTIYTQPTVLTTSYACYKVLLEGCREADIDLDVFLLAGHSLGEYTALLVAGAIDFENTVNLVHKRATYMTESGRAYPDAGLMAVVDRGGEIDYQKLCALCKNYGVYITLNNTRSQIVVGGSKKNLDELAKELRKDGKLGRLLKVEGPFHTPIMRPAADKFRKELEKVEIHIASKPVMANVLTEAVVDPNQIRRELYEQIFNIVNWRGSIERIVRNGGDLFIEVGPKKVLSNMMNEIAPSMATLNVEDLSSLEKTIKVLSEQAEV
ncbi:MAG: ACP S-malonyltransferase [Pseudomonadota bacterium]